MADPSTSVSILGPLAIIIVHYGRAAPTLDCLAAVTRDYSRIERRTVVVDCSGTLAETDLGAEVVRLDCRDNPGYGGGANRGVRILEDRSWLGYVILNHDLLIQPGFLDAAAVAISEGAGAAGGPVRLDASDGDLWYAGGGLCRVTGTVWQSRSERQAVLPKEVGFLPGCAMVVSSEAWHEVGGFDSSYFLYNEDLDLCLRLRRAGWPLRFLPALSSVHLLGAASGSRELSPLYLEYLTANRLRPFQCRSYRAYLGGLHSLYVAYRCVNLLLRFRSQAGPRVAALLRGHFAAIRSSR